MENPIYVSNGGVAWEIPKRIGRRFIDGIYIIPDGWAIHSRRLGTAWVRGLLGELRLCRDQEEKEWKIVSDGRPN